MIIKITLADTRIQAIFHHFSYLIDSEQFTFLHNDLGRMEKFHSFFINIGEALQLAIRPEKNHSPDRTPALVTLVYVRTNNDAEKKIVLGYQQHSDNQELKDIIHITEVDLVPKSISAKVNRSIDYLKTFATAATTVRKRSTDGRAGSVILEYAAVESEFPTSDLALVEEVAMQMLEKKYKESPFYGMNSGFLNIKPHPRLAYKKLVDEEHSTIDMNRFYALYPQAQLDYNQFSQDGKAKLCRVEGKVNDKNEKIRVLKTISSSQAASELLPENLLWHTFVTTQVGPAIRILSGEVKKLEALAGAYAEVCEKDFGTHFGELALEYDAHQIKITRMRNDLTRSIQLAFMHIWTWMAKKLNYKITEPALDFYHKLFSDFVKVKTIDGIHVLQFEDLYDPNFNLIQKYNALLVKISKKIEYHKSLDEIIFLLAETLKSSLRGLKIYYQDDDNAKNNAEVEDKAEVIFEVLHPKEYMLSDAGFQRHLARQIAYDNTEITAKMTEFHKAADSSLAQESVDPLMNSFESIVADSAATLAVIKEIKSLSDALTIPVRNTLQLIHSANELYAEVKKEYDELSAAAESAGVDFSEVDDAQVELSYYHSELENMSTLIKTDFSAIATADSLASAIRVSDTVRSLLTPSDGSEQNQFEETLEKLKQQAVIVRDLNVRCKVDIDKKIMDNHYIDTVLKYKSFLQDQVPFWHKNTTQFLCLGGTRAVGSKLKVQRGIAEQMQIVNRYGAHNLDGNSARKVWAELQKVARQAQQRKTGVGFFYFNLRKDPASKFYLLTGSQYDINSQQDVSLCLRQINNEWRYKPKPTGFSVTNNEEFSDFYLARR